MLCGAVSTFVQTELSREVNSSLPWQYATEAITHSECRRFICLSYCRETAGSTDTTLEWWAKTGTPHHQQPCTHTHGPSHPFQAVRAQPVWLGRSCCCLLNVALPSHAPTPWSCSVLSSSARPDEGTETFLQAPGKQEATPTLLSATYEALMLCVIFVYCLGISQPGEHSISVI